MYDIKYSYALLDYSEIYGLSFNCGF